MTEMKFGGTTLICIEKYTQRVLNQIKKDGGEKQFQAKIVRYGEHPELAQVQRSMFS